jgi:hypothetical protein
MDSLTAATLALVFATIGLFAATVTYAYYSKRLAVTTEKTRRSQITPVMRGSLLFNGDKLAGIRVRNIGSSSATDVDVTIRVPGFNVDRRWRESVMIPMQYTDIFIPQITEAKFKVQTIALTGKCKNVDGEKVEVNDTMDVPYLLESIQHQDMTTTKTTDDRLEIIADRLDDIATKLDKSES